MSTLSASASANANGGIGFARVRKMTVVPMIAATYFMVAGGPYGLEDIVQKTGYQATLLILLITPLLWSIPDGDDGQRTCDVHSRRRRILHLGSARHGALHGLSGNVADDGGQRIRNGAVPEFVRRLHRAVCAGTWWPAIAGLRSDSR